MTSPARAHFLRLSAAQSGPAPAAPSPVGVQMLAMLRAHRVTLKGIQSRQAKIAAKATFLPDYADYIDGLLAAGATGPDAELLTTILVWRLDVRDWAGALAIARHALAAKLAMPERFARDLPTTLVEEVATALLANPADPDTAEAMAEVLTLTDGLDMPDEVRAKAEKGLGQHWRDRAPATALDHLRRALTLDPGAGVKTEIARAEKALAALPESGGNDPATPGA